LPVMQERHVDARVPLMPAAEEAMQLSEMSGRSQATERRARVMSEDAVRNRWTRQSTNSLRGELNALDSYSKGRRSDARARQVLVRHIFVALRVATWTVVLYSPWIIWPWGNIWVDEATDKAKHWPLAATYVNYWSSMVLQVLFSVHANLGTTVKLTCQGVLGTLISCGNMVFLNDVLGSWLGGGAANDRVCAIYADDGSCSIYQSTWLPLCNNGSRELAQSGAFCLFNVYWAQLEFAGFCKMLFVSSNFLFIVVLVLTMGFDDNSRMFALSTHVYFIMAFLDPSTLNFMRFPTLSFSYTLMTVPVGAAAAVLMLSFPTQILALNDAEELARECVGAVGLLVESLPGTTAGLTRQKAMSTLEETNTMLQELDVLIETAWFECFDFAGRGARRQRLIRLSRALHACVRRIPATHHTAEALDVEDMAFLQTFGAVRTCSSAVRDFLTTASEDRGAIDAAELADSAVEMMHEDFAVVRDELSQESCAFVFMVCGVLQDSLLAIKRYEMEPSLPPRKTFLKRLKDGVRVISQHFGLKLLDKASTHPRFVIRNSISISLAFWIGFIGLYNVIPAYASTPASVVAVVIYTYTGASVNISLSRINGIVLGKVIGTMVQLAFGVQNAGWVACWTGCTWGIVAFAFFVYLHSPQFGYVACLAGAYAGAAVLPAGGFRGPNNNMVKSDVKRDLFDNIAEAVLGVLVMICVDLAFSSRASNQARQRLQRCIRRGAAYADAVFCSDISGAPKAGTCEVARRDVLSDVAALAKLIPYADAEPSMVSFKTPLYEKLHKHMGKMVSHLATCHWAVVVRPNCVTDSYVPSAVTSVVASTNSSNILTEEAFQPLFQRVQERVASMLASVKLLADYLTRHKQEEDHTADIRRQLQGRLYTTRAIKHVNATARDALQDVAKILRIPTRESQSESSDGESRGLRQRLREHLPERVQQFGEQVGEGARRIGDLVLKENIEGLSHSGRSESIDTEIVDEERRQTDPEQAPAELEEVFGHLREVAAQMARSCPLEDNSCRVETIILQIKSVLLEIQQMQMALMEY